MNRPRLPHEPVHAVGAAMAAESPQKPKIKTSWHPITSCPRDTTVQLMHKSGGVDTGVYHKFVEQVYTHWAPLPQSKDQKK
jgi:hypothetical protein